MLIYLLFHVFPALQIFREARRTSPSIVYLPHINQWWHVLGDTVRTTLLTLIQDLDPTSPLLLLATSEEKYEDLDYTVSYQKYVA